MLDLQVSIELASSGKILFSIYYLVPIDMLCKCIFSMSFMINFILKIINLLIFSAQLPYYIF